jgi:hypothetical protein
MSERDIVERLCDPAFPPPPAGSMALRLSAADEIERLRAVLAVIKAAVEKDDKRGWCSNGYCVDSCIMPKVRKVLCNVGETAENGN